MNNKSFDQERIAQGYAKDRPYLHPQVMEIVKEDLKLDSEVRNGLDIGCGAGLSTKALKMLCGHVTGTDISPEMIQAAGQMCKEEGFSFYTCKAEEVSGDIRYDIVTAAGMINWVDEEAFLKNLSHIMMPAGYLVIYDFWITDKMQENNAYTDWWNMQYLPKFPKPFRKEDQWTDREAEKFGFRITGRKQIELTWEFDMEAFIRFMMIQSNVNEQIEERTISERDASDWFRETLSDIFDNEVRTLIFKGYIWYFINKIWI